MIRKVLIGMLSVIVALVIAAEIYSRNTDSNVTSALPDVGGTATNIVFVFHGSGGGDKPIFQEIAEIHAAANPNAVVLNYDWSRGSENRLRAMANGEAIGENLGADLARLEKLQRVHMIAHSVGAAIPDALCSALRKTRHGAVRIETVYLDPFGRKGLFHSAYGSQHYGQCADFAIAYINTSDRAPTTNSPLDNAYNWDVTHTPGGDSIEESGHYWPVYYYRDLIEEDPQATSGGSHDLLPRGEFSPAQ